MTEVKKADIERAASSFTSLTGTEFEEAKVIVKFVFESVAQNTLEVFVGDKMLAATLVDQRVEIVNHVCMNIDRPLTTPEIQALFRITPSAARVIENKVQSTYARPLQKQYLADMEDDGSYERVGSEVSEFRYTITFTKASTYNTALREISRIRLGSFIFKKDPTNHVITFKTNIDWLQKFKSDD